MIIIPHGLLQGDRLSHCSDQAQLHFPRIVALANGFGRVELRASKIIELAYAHLTGKPSTAELTKWVGEYQTNYLLFVYSTSGGEVWGQFSMPKDAYPRYKTAADNRSPAPIASEVAAFDAEYQLSKSAKAKTEGDYLDVSGDFGNIPKSSKTSETFPCGIGIGKGKGIGIGEEQEQRLLCVSNALQNSTDGGPEEFLESWNAYCGKMKKIIKLTAERRKKVSLRMREGLTLERFTEAVKIAARTPFLRGEGSTGTWKCDFDFLIKNETNLVKLFEGGYGEPDQLKPVFVEVSAEQWRGGQSLV